MDPTNAAHVDLGSLGSFDFKPDWVRKEAGVSVGPVTPERSAQGAKGRKSDRRNGEGRAYPDRGRPGHGKAFVKRDGGDAPRSAERVKALDAEIKILPETKALGTIFRKLQQGCLAYKLKDLAYFFLDNPQSILLKVTPRSGEKFHQCKVCSFASVNREDVVAHAVQAHLGEYYDIKEIDREPPKGNFPCVARCGLSGELLGPPNMHGFNALVAETARTRFPEMSLERYRSHIEMVRDQQVIEEWRSRATKVKVYVPKGAADASPDTGLSPEQAEAEFRRNILASLLAEPKNLMITADVAVRSPFKPLVLAVRAAIEAERRSPYNICYALRGAFHHRKMRFFRVNDARGQEFVTSVEHKEFDAEHAIEELRNVARFVEENPCCDRGEFPAGDAQFAKYLDWLVNTGHVVAFSNGVFSKVEKFPKYGPKWRKRSKTAEAAEEKQGEEGGKDETAGQLA